MGSQPQLSIITVVLNCRDDLAGTIASLADQNLEGVEYVVVDGASTDGTLEVINHHSNIISSWVSEPDRGIYDAMNKGIGMSSGRAVMMLNAGDELVPGVLGRLVKAVDENAIVYGDFIREKNGSSIDCKAKARFVPGMMLCHQAMLVGRKVHDRQGLYDTNFHLAGDYDFLIRCSEAGEVFRKEPYPFVHFRYEGATVTHYRKSYAETIYAAWRWLPWYKSGIVAARFSAAYAVRRFLLRH